MNTSADSYLHAIAQHDALTVDFPQVIHGGSAPTTNGSPASLVAVITRPLAEAMNTNPKVAMFLSSGGQVVQGGKSCFATSAMAALAFSILSKESAAIPPNQLASRYSALTTHAEMLKKIKELIEKLTPKLTVTTVAGRQAHAKA